MTSSTTDKKNIYQRVLMVMDEVDFVQKEDANSGLRYRFASHDSVMAALHKPMTRAGIVFVPTVEFYGFNGTYHELKLKCEFINADNPEDRITVLHQIPSRFAGEEKAYGCTLSYAVKYSLLKMFMLETGEDADSEQGDKGKNIPKQEYKKPVPTQAPTQPKPQEQKVPQNIVDMMGEETKTLCLGITKKIPVNIPVKFVREQLESIQARKNISWNEVQEEAVKNIDKFIKSVENNYILARQSVNSPEKLTTAI